MNQPGPPIDGRPPHQRGVALVVVLWAAILLALIGGAVTQISRTDLNLTRNLIEGTKAELAADSALWTAVHTIVNQGPAAWPADGTIYAWKLGGAKVRVRVSDELERIDLNATSPELLSALFEAAGVAPDEAAQLTEAVVEFRTSRSEAQDVSSDAQNPTAQDPPFAVIDQLLQVPGMSRALQDQLAGALTVYTGRPLPRAGTGSALVLAATEGRVLDAPDVEAETLETEENFETDERPTALNPPQDSSAARTGLLHIEAEALSAGGSYFARDAVIALNRRDPLAFQLRLWRQGPRTLFPISGDLEQN